MDIGGPNGCCGLSDEERIASSMHIQTLYRSDVVKGGLPPIHYRKSGAANMLGTYDLTHIMASPGPFQVWPTTLAKTTAATRSKAALMVPAL